MKSGDNNVLKNTTDKSWCLEAPTQHPQSNANPRKSLCHPTPQPTDNQIAMGTGPEGNMQ